MRRGISGGQKKRLTLGSLICRYILTIRLILYIPNQSKDFSSSNSLQMSVGNSRWYYAGEMLVGPTNVFFMDEISNGLDSSTAYQIVSFLQQLCHATDATIIVSLLQPAPEIYDLFDDIIFMAEGKIVYQGPRDEVLEFFDTCGFKCPARKEVACFLQEASAPYLFLIFESDNIKIFDLIPGYCSERSRAVLVQILGKIQLCFSSYVLKEI